MPEDEQRGWREAGHDALVYFGLADAEPSEDDTPSEPWWHTALWIAPPIVAGWFLAPLLGVDRSFYTVAALTFGCMAIWGTVTGIRDGGSSWKRPWVYLSVGYAALVTWLLHKNPHNQSDVFLLCTLGPYLAALGVGRWRKSRK